MRRPGGYATIIGPDTHVAQFDRFRCETVTAGMFERDTFSCAHCNRIVHVKPFAPMDDFGSMCRKCMKLVCPNPTCNDRCLPFEKRLDESEKAIQRGIDRDYVLREYGL